MTGLAKLNGLVLFFLIIPFHLSAQQPVWHFDLRGVGFQFEGADTGLKFYGQFLVVYSGSIYSGSMRPVLVFAQDTGQLISQERGKVIYLPRWDECGRTIFKKASPEVNIIDCRGQMRLEQIGGIGRGVQKGDTEYYLQEPGKDKVLLSRGHCRPSAPHFISDKYVLVTLCNGKRIVANKQGQKVYAMPKLSDIYVAPSLLGTRFAVHERDSSFLGQFNDITDKKRMTVFRSSDGKKLFEYRWGDVDDDGLNDGRVALSDDGSLAALIRAREVMVFAVPSHR
jgi:hypothetical protein